MRQNCLIACPGACDIYDTYLEWYPIVHSSHANTSFSFDKWQSDELM